MNIRKKKNGAKFTIFNATVIACDEQILFLYIVSIFTLVCLNMQCLCIQICIHLVAICTCGVLIPNISNCKFGQRGGIKMHCCFFSFSYLSM